MKTHIEKLLRVFVKLIESVIECMMEAHIAIPVWSLKVELNWTHPLPGWTDSVEMKIQLNLN